jgi:hypothetical protein
MDVLVACADIGSVKSGNFGWAVHDPAGGETVVDHHSIEALAAEMAGHLERGRAVALGFECPLYVPLREDPMALNLARNGEGNRAWCAGAGSGALATGLVQVNWILREIRRLMRSNVTAGLDWPELVARGSGLFLWEAFVSSKAKSKTHHGDAALAVEAFVRALPDPAEANAVNEHEVVSLIGMALLRSGWTEDPRVLEQTCLVIKV